MCMFVGKNCNEGSCLSWLGLNPLTSTKEREKEREKKEGERGRERGEREREGGEGERGGRGRERGGRGRERGERERERGREGEGDTLNIIIYTFLSD